MSNGCLIIPREKLEVVSDDLQLMGFFVLLVSLARFREGTASDGTVIRPGQIATGRKKLASMSNRCESWCNRALTRLEKRRLIERQPNRGWTRLTICDWELYSSLPKRSEQRANTNRTASEHGSNPSRTGSGHYRRQEAEGRKTSPLPPPSDRAWREEEEVLRGLGLRQVTDATQAAIGAGCTVDDWRPHREHWERHRDGWESPAGVLYSRLKQLRPGQAADEAWPRLSEAARRTRRVRDETEAYDRRIVATKQWRSWTAEKQQRVLCQAGLSSADAQELLRRDPGAAERHAVAFVAPALKLADTSNVRG